jgi:DNA-binding transcriptional LysR family regulator
MRLSQIDLNLFTVFDAIYREGGITPASKRLHLSQSAVSHALARLRELLNDPLFERHGNEMTPTPRARALAGTVGNVLTGLEEMLQRAEQFDPATSERIFTIAMRDSHEATFLPAMLDIFGTEAPRVRIASVRLDRRELANDLMSGNLDVAVDMELPVSADIRRQRIDSEPLVVLARKDHPVVRASIDLDTYVAQEHVLVTGRRRGMGYEDAVLQRVNLQRLIRVRCQQYMAAAEVVSRSDLLVTMPRHYAERANRHCGNQVLPFPVEAPMLEVFLYWHANVDLEPAHRWFRERAFKSI